MDEPRPEPPKDPPIPWAENAGDAGDFSLTDPIPEPLPPLDG